jgi:hypothetical protein
VGTGAATAAVGAVTTANRLGAFRLAAIAASPRAIGDGRLWLLLSSAAIADRPAVASLLGFWIVGVAVLSLCGWRVAVVAGFVGHVLATLAVYGVVGAVRLADPGALGRIVTLDDYGLSAIMAAWLGAISAASWAGHRLGVVALCASSAAIGLLLRPDLTLLDSEHVVAFALGVAVVLAGRSRPQALPHSVGSRLLSRTSAEPG